jgi:Tfp pilus assembly protein PilX
MSTHRDMRRDDGQAMMLVVALVALLTVIAVALIGVVTDETKSSSHAVVKQTSFQAAEAGIDDYTSKLVEDHLYYVHQVFPGESTRKASNGTLVAAGNAWPYDLTWTYPTRHDAWRSLSNGYQYNLEITPPSAATPAVTIIATGRPASDANTSDWRQIETMIRPTSLADFYRVVNGNVAFGSTTTTHGQIYANGNVTHDGIATANIYAEGTISGSVSMQNGAKKYDHNTIRSVIPSPIQFSSFLASLTDIKNASQNGGVYLNSTTSAAWRLIFNSNGTFTAQKCNQSGSSDVAAKTPSCASATTYNVPSNGAVYSPQTVIVEGTVHGRVTVASNNNVDVSNNISYATAGQDVLGLIAQNNVIVCDWAPNTLTWTAAVLAESGTWETYSSGLPSGRDSSSSMTFTGSSATALGGDFTGFASRTYDYDPNLLYLSPPWFPVIADAYTTLLFRELHPS